MPVIVLVAGEFVAQLMQCEQEIFLGFAAVLPDKMNGYMADGRFTARFPDAPMRELAKLALVAKGIKVAGVVDTRL